MPPKELMKLSFGDELSPKTVTGFTFDNGRVRVSFSSIPDATEEEEHRVEVSFPNAIIKTINENESMRDGWPLEFRELGYEPVGQRWLFILNCETVEWSWESDWPVARTLDGQDRGNEATAVKSLFRVK